MDRRKRIILQEHPGLARHKAPIARSILLEQLSLQHRPSPSQVLRQAPEILLPHRPEARVPEDIHHQPRTKPRLSPGLCPGQELHLLLGPRRGLSGGHRHAEMSDALTVQAERLAVRHGEQERSARLSKQADGRAVLRHAAGHEAWVGEVEEGEVLLGLECLREAPPLFCGRIAAGRVVPADLKHDDGLGRDMCKGLIEAVEVKRMG